jgi:hypothetical protein
MVFYNEERDLVHRMPASFFPKEGSGTTNDHVLYNTNSCKGHYQFDYARNIFVCGGKPSGFLQNPVYSETLLREHSITVESKQI